MSAEQFRRLRKGKAKGKSPQRHERGRMNKTEAAYADLLAKHKLSGEVKDWWFERLTFWLAPRTTYTPDYAVLRKDDTICMVEVKGGFRRDDAMVKFKTAAEAFPWFSWKMVEGKHRKATDWQWKTFLEFE